MIAFVGHDWLQVRSTVPSLREVQVVGGNERFAGERMDWRLNLLSSKEVLFKVH